MELKDDAAIDHVNQGFTIVHAHVIFVLEALDQGARNALVTALYRISIG